MIGEYPLSCPPLLHQHWHHRCPKNLFEYYSPLWYLLNM
jgi:hypothetical protein